MSGAGNSENGHRAKPWFAPLCRQGPHPLIGHHVAMKRLCDCPCHETDGPWWSEIEGGGPTEFDLSATALSADATPAASADVGPDMTMHTASDG